MSPTDSPRASCSSSPRRTSGVAPSSATPTSNETRVRVEGFSKTSATLRPASASAPGAVARARLSARRAVEQRAELEGAELLAGEEVAASSTRILRGVQFTRNHLEPVPRPRLPARPGAASPGARGCCGSPSATRPTSRSTATSTAEFAAMLAGAEWDVALLQECPPRFAEPLAARLRRRGAPGADLAQLARRRCARLAAALNPDLIASGEGGSNLTLVRARGARRDRRAARAGDPRGPARAPGDGLHPHRARASASRTCTRPTTCPTLAAEDVLRAAARGDRVGGRGAAALRRRPQPAPGREPGDLRASSRALRPRRRRPRPTRSTTCSSAASRSLEPPTPLAARAARGARATAWRCASPTTPRSRRVSNRSGATRPVTIVASLYRPGPAATQEASRMAAKKSKSGKATKAKAEAQPKSLASQKSRNRKRNQKPKPKAESAESETASRGDDRPRQERRAVPRKPRAATSPSAATASRRSSTTRSSAADDRAATPKRWSPTWSRGPPADRQPAEGAGTAGPPGPQRASAATPRRCANRRPRPRGAPARNSARRRGGDR